MFAEQAQAAGAKPQVSNMDEHEAGLLIDFDGFFKTLVEMGECPPSGALAALPLTDIEAVRAETYRQLFESAMWFPRKLTGRRLDVASTVWKTLALKSAVIAATNDGIRTDQWGAFYAQDLDEFMTSRYPELAGTMVKLTLAPRLVARTHLDTRTIYLSALTRFHLLAMNTALANYAELVVEHGKVLTSADTFEFFEFAFAQLLPLHRRIAPSPLTALPHAASAAQFAQRITQIQMVFLMAHEYGHIVIESDDNETLNIIEKQCDEFAFEILSQLETPGWMQFLAVRWLFEILAFDRVLAECLSWNGDDWHGGVDWLQDELRERRAFSRFLNDADGGVLSLYESVGSVFLLDLKGWLYELGPKALNAKVQLVKRRNPRPTGEEYSVMVRAMFDKVPDDEYLSVQQLMGRLSSQWKQSQSG
jgi:hypothetical protein